MKTIKIFGTFILAAIIAACTPEPISVEDVTADSEELQATHTIKEFLDTSGQEALFSVDDIPMDGEDIIIRGRVVTDDYAGNFYKTLIIQDEKDHTQTLRIGVDGGSISGMFPMGQVIAIRCHTQTLRIGVDGGSISGMFPMGQVIAIRCNGLAVGKYASQRQLCAPSYNNNQYATNAAEKVGWAPGRIPLPLFHKAVKAIGLPDKSKIVVDTLTISDILNSTKEEMDGRLVCIKNVFFNQKYENYGKWADLTNGNPAEDGAANVFAPTTNFLNFPQGRGIEDAEGNAILVSTSEYAKYAYMYIPEEQYVGNVTGIAGFYWDNAKYDPDDFSWSISLRSLDDLELYDNGDKSKPWTPTEWSDKK